MQPGGDKGAGGDALEVIVVGGGLVGLATAVELGRRGVRTLVLERDEAVPTWHPRMFQVQARTFEHFRRWGIEADVRAASPLAADVADDTVFAKGLTESFIAQVPHYDPTGGPRGPISSADGGFVAQWLTEGVLERTARGLPSVRVERGASVVSVDEDSDGVEVTFERIDGGPSQIRRARYVVGADGAGSVVRKAAGIEYEGGGDVGRWLYVPFSAPALADAGLVARGVLYILFRPTGMTAARWLTPERWDMQIAGVAPGELSPDELDARVREAIGRDDVAFTRGPEAPVRLQEQTAARFRNGRMFVAGNAAHLLPHTGGHNGNMGVGDAVDLGWKLAAVLQGWGGELLLDSYERERREIALRTRDTVLATMRSTEETLRGLSRLGYPEGPGPENDALREQFLDAIDRHSRAAWRANGVTLDQRYTDSPVLVPNGRHVPDWDPGRLSPIVAPGHRAPHVPEGDGGSLHDEFGDGFVLLRLGDAAPDGSGLIDASRARGIPLRTVSRPHEGYHELFGRSLTLVRPDGHIAWSEDHLPEDPARLLDIVTGRVDASAHVASTPVRSAT